MQLIGMAIDDVTLRARLAILSTRFDRTFEHGLGARLRRVELDGAELVEIERHRARLAEITAELGEDRAHLARGAVAIVGERFDDDAHPARAEAHVVALCGTGCVRL